MLNSGYLFGMLKIRDQPKVNSVRLPLKKIGVYWFVNALPNVLAKILTIWYEHLLQGVR